jgi:tripartite-type tricarboxylate transporter receptor subunit TctC
VNAAVATKEVAEVYAKAGIYPKPLSANEFEAFVKAETARWGKLVTLSGAQAE